MKPGETQEAKQITSIQVATFSWLLWNIGARIRTDIGGVKSQVDRLDGSDLHKAKIKDSDVRIDTTGKLLKAIIGLCRW
ncbi:MAG: hypothetical protein RMJ88_09855 [Thermogemmata sp.]|nr:hypothetical protein [Thermogemmata sp.]